MRLLIIFTCSAWWLQCCLTAIKLYGVMSEYCLARIPAAGLGGAEYFYLWPDILLKLDVCMIWMATTLLVALPLQCAEGVQLVEKCSSKSCEQFIYLCNAWPGVLVAKTLCRTKLSKRHYCMCLHADYLAFALVGHPIYSRASPPAFLLLQIWLQSLGNQRMHSIFPDGCLLGNGLQPHAQACAAILSHIFRRQHCIKARTCS